jgi:outer membrane biosynthesis protein TonB
VVVSVAGDRRLRERTFGLETPFHHASLAPIGDVSCVRADLRGFIPPMKKLVLLALFALVACGSETPVPDYPFPASPPLEETDLAMYVEDTAGEEEEVVEEEWDDGMDDAPEETPAPEAAPEPEPAPAAEAAPAEPAPAPARRRAR